VLTLSGDPKTHHFLATLVGPGRGRPDGDEETLGVRCQEVIQELEEWVQIR
jgi:hypothetical protein